MAAGAVPIIEAGLAIAPVVVDLAKKVIGLFHHTKVVAAPGAPATAAGTVPLTPAQAQTTAAAAAATFQSMISTAVANGSLPASAAPDVALLPAILQVAYSLTPQTAAAATTATPTIGTLTEFLQAYETISAALKAAPKAAA